MARGATPSTAFCTASEVPCTARLFQIRSRSNGIGPVAWQSLWALSELKPAQTSPMKTLRTLLAALALLLLALLLLAPALHADTLTVTSDADSGAGTLRQAVLDAAASGDTIVFDAGLSGAFIGLYSEIEVAKSLTIDATSLPAGVTSSGMNASRIFTVNSGQIVTLRALTLAGGNGVGLLYVGYGGAIFNDGGTLTLMRCTLSGNAIPNGDSGAIRNGG